MRDNLRTDPLSGLSFALGVMLLGIALVSWILGTIDMARMFALGGGILAGTPFALVAISKWNRNGRG